MDIFDTLLQKALEVRKNAYAPYSHFSVGAAILTLDNNIYSGCNVENACFRLGVCAESSAICQMVAAGERKMKDIVIIGTGSLVCTPCGACRQQIHEFADPMLAIHMGNEQGILKTLSIGELLPYAFDGNHLENL